MLARLVPVGTATPRPDEDTVMNTPVTALPGTEVLCPGCEQPAVVLPTTVATPLPDSTRALLVRLHAEGLQPHTNWTHPHPSGVRVEFGWTDPAPQQLHGHVLVGVRSGWVLRGDIQSCLRGDVAPIGFGGRAMPGTLDRYAAMIEAAVTLRRADQPPTLLVPSIAPPPGAVAIRISPAPGAAEIAVPADVGTNWPSPDAARLLAALQVLGLDPHVDWQHATSGALVRILFGHPGWTVFGAVKLGTRSGHVIHGEVELPDGKPNLVVIGGGGDWSRTLGVLRAEITERVHATTGGLALRHACTPSPAIPERPRS